MPVALTVNYKQIINLINQMNQTEQAKLSDYLNNITAERWLVSFRNRMKDIPVSMNEITDLVEDIRNSNYEGSH